MLNDISIMGRLTATPELKTTVSGNSVTRFTVAVERDFSKSKETDFFSCVAWHKTADFITKYFAKGQMIAIRGRLQQRIYNDKDDNKRTDYVIVAENVYFCGSKEKSDLKAVDESDFEEISMSDEDLPF